MKVTVPPNPLRDVSADSAYIKSSWSRSRDPSLQSEGETAGEVASTSKNAILSTALVPLHYPVDLPAEQTAVMAPTQRPIAELAFSEPCGPPAWKSVRPGP